jgi:predicted nuclease of predicted toxin-antitoxin system
VKFLVDMPLSPVLAEWLRNQGHDAVHVATIGLDRAADTEIIAQATLDGRTIVTADLDYPRLLALAGASEPGLILFRGGDWSDREIIARLKQVLDRIQESELEQSILVVDRGRIRRRRLPVVR